MKQVTAELLKTWCCRLLDTKTAHPTQSANDELLAGVPRLETLSALPKGTTVLVRGDVDAKPGKKMGQGDIRLRSMRETLIFGRQRGWRQVVFGHVGRRSEGSLAAVSRRLGEILGDEVPLIDDWLDEATLAIRPGVATLVQSSPPGRVHVLENTRRYGIERVLWNTSADQMGRWVAPLATLVNQFATQLGTTFVHEALSAGNLDTSSAVVPAAMEQVALGAYAGRELSGPMMRCLKAQLVVFSGLKIDKLDQLEAMIRRGRIRHVLAGGSLAMALIKANARLEGKESCLGVAEDLQHKDQPYYIAPERIEQAERMLAQGWHRDIDFVLPQDFVLEDGRVVEELSPSDRQCDVGPKTGDRFAAKIGQFLSDDTAGRVAFHNGVLGMFEDPKFAVGTRRFTAQLKRMTEAGVEVYVGGGEGGKALERFGAADWVKHVFTAGGTVLSVLGGREIPYLLALKMAAQQGACAAGTTAR